MSQIKTKSPTMCLYLPKNCARKLLNDVQFSRCVCLEVQLPRVRLSDSALKWNVTFLKTKSEARTIFLINSSDMPAPFEWITGVHREGQRSSGLEVICSNCDFWNSSVFEIIKCQLFNLAISLSRSG